MTRAAENALFAELALSRSAEDMPGAPQFCLGMLVPAAAPTKLVLSAMQLQVALRLQTRHRSTEQPRMSADMRPSHALGG